MEIDKLFENNSIDSVADNVFGVVNNSVSEVREMQRKKVAENVQLVVNALKKIEQDIKDQYDSVSNNLEKRIISIKDGRDGIDGRDGKDGKDGKQGKDGRPGRDGKDGKNGLNGESGEDGVSVVNAHIDFDGSLIISLSSGKEINVGEVVAPALAEQIKVITNGGGTSQSVLDTLTSLQSQIDALSGATIYKGLWNASTNSPALTSSVGTSGNFYIVSVAGSTSLDGITNWGVGDWAIFNGSVWQRVEGGAAGNFTTVTASSLTSGRVTYAGTAGLLQDSSNLTFNGTTLTSTGFSGPLNGTVGATTPAAGAFTTLASTGLSVVNSAASILRATINASNVTAQQVDIAFTNSGGSTYIGQDAAGNSFIDARGALNAITLGYSGAVVTTIGTTGLTMASGMSIRGSNNLTLNATTGNSVIAQVNNATVGAFSSTGLAVTGTLSATGVATFPAGSAAAPAITTSGDTNNGIFFPAADVTAITTAGSERMRIDSSGNVGIGTASPSGKLQVEASGARIIIGNSGTDNYYDGSFHIFRGALSSGAPERMRIDSSGNVGIGTSLPGAKLDVNGAAYIRPSGAGLYVDAITAYSGTSLSINGGSSNINFVVNASERMRIDSSGNLTVTGGTITTGSTTALSLATSGGTVAQFANVASQVNYWYLYGNATGNSPAIQVAGSDTNVDAAFSSKGTGALRFYTNAVTNEQVRITHTASANRYITLTGSNGGNPTIGTSAGSLAISTNTAVSGAGAFTGTTTIGNDQVQIGFSSPEGFIKSKNSSGSPASNLGFYTTDGAGTQNKVLTLNFAKNMGFNGTSYGSGEGVIFLANASVVPSANPTGGGVLYVDGGALKYRGSSGTITTIANA